MAFDAIPFAIDREASLYRRPDVLTKTDTKLVPLDVVAAFEVKGDSEWVRIKGKPAGEKWFKEGWVKWNNVIAGEKNIALAVYSKLIEAEINEENKSEQLASVLDNTELQNEILFPAFQKKFGIYNADEHFDENSPIGDFLKLLPEKSLPYTAGLNDNEGCEELSIQHKTDILGLSKENA